MEYFESPWQRSTGGCQRTSAHRIKKYKKIEHIIRGKNWAKITEEQMRWIGFFVISLGLLIGTPVVFISIIWLRTFFFFKNIEMSLCSLCLSSSFSLSSARKRVSGSSSTMCPLDPQKACTPQVILNTHLWVTSPTTEPTPTTE